MDEMRELAALGTALRPDEDPSDQLRARVLGGMTEAPATVVRRRRWVAPAVAAAGAAALVAGVVLLGGADPDAGKRPPSRDDDVVSEQPADKPAARPAAFAVRANADGSVTFTARDVVDPTAATRALNDAGITGRVLNWYTAGCASGPFHDGEFDPTDLDPDDIGVQKEDLRRSGSVTVRASDYPAGGGLLLVVITPDPAKSSPVGKNEGTVVVVFAFRRAERIPACA
jgi:hypothetical protein